MTSSFKLKFRVEQLTVSDFNYWVVSIRPHQPTLGSLVLSLKRTCASLGEIRPEEAAELAEVFKTMESKLKKVFNYDKINYLCLMMVDHHVHFHVIPRYDTSQQLGEFILKDTGWPGPPILTAFTDNEQLLLKIKSLLTLQEV